MSSNLEKMLEAAHNGFVKRDVEAAQIVLRTDSELDRACHKIFRHHFTSMGANGSDSGRILFIAQAVERAGDHAKNLGEEVIHLVRGQSLRHASRTRLKSD